MRADEYLHLQAACVAMARQSQTLEVKVRWAKLADAASVAADAPFIGVGNRRAAIAFERKIPVAIRARIQSEQVRAAAGDSGRSQQKAPPSVGNLDGAKFVKWSP